MKVVLPWIFVMVLLAGLGWAYSTSQRKEAELVVLRGNTQQLDQARADLEQAKTSGAQAASDELTRLRKEHDELLRLRNEVRQLRTDKQQLSTQVQTAQAQAQSAQEQAQQLRSSATQPAIPAPMDAAARAAFERRYGLVSTNAEQIQFNACINNLRVIDGAKQQWALENKKAPGALMTAADLAPYLRSNALPACPAGGIYTLNPVNAAPICSIPGHAIPR